MVRWYVRLGVLDSVGQQLMQTPAGYEVNAAVSFISAAAGWPSYSTPASPTSWCTRWSAAYLTTAFLVGGVGAWHLLKTAVPARRLMFSMAIVMAASSRLCRSLLGDMHGLTRWNTSPSK